MLKNKKTIGILAAVLLGLGAAIPLALARMDPLREVKAQIKRPNMMIILDTSGSMMWEVPTDTKLTRGADNPLARLAIAKGVLRTVVADMADVVNFGLMTFYQSYHRKGDAKGFYAYQKTTTTAGAAKERYFDLHWLSENPTTGTPHPAWGGVATGPRNFTYNGVTYTLGRLTGTNNNSYFERRGRRGWERYNTVHNYTPSECYANHGRIYCTFNYYTWQYLGSYYTYTPYTTTTTWCYTNDYQGKQFVNTGGLCAGLTTDIYVYPEWSCQWMDGSTCCAYPCYSSSEPYGCANYRSDSTVNQMWGSQPIGASTGGCTDRGVRLVDISTDPAVQAQKVNEINQYLQSMDDGGVVAVGATPIARSLNRGESIHDTICKKGSTECSTSNCTTWDDAYHYFRDTVIPADPASQASPPCRKNFVLLVTDGEPTADPQTGEPGLAENAAETLRVDVGVKTYVIGFGNLASGPKATLNSLAIHGGTDHAYFADDAASLNTHIREIINEAAKGDYTTAPPSYTFAQGGTGTVVFFSSAKYPEWSGHLRAVDGHTNTQLWDAGELLNSRRSNSRRIYTYDPTATDGYPIPFTTTNPSFSTLKAMGLGSSDDEARSIILFIRGVGRDDYLGDIVNSAPSTLVPPPWKELGAFNYSDFLDLYGYAYDSSSGYGIWVPRRNIVVFSGANDGMFHAFTMEGFVDKWTNETFRAGEEVWAFIPPDLIPRLKDLYMAGGQIAEPANHIYYVAASPKIEDVYVDDTSTWKTVLTCGEGPGGSHLFTLDVTHPSPNDPNFGFGQTPKVPFQVLWTTADPHHPTNPAAHKTGYEYLGETWSNPAFGKIRYLDGTEKTDDVLFTGSGYDDIHPGYVPHVGIGTTIYVIRVTDGSIITTFNVGDASGTLSTEFSLLANTVSYGYGSMFGWNDTSAATDTWKLSDLMQVDLNGKIWNVTTVNSNVPTAWTATNLTITGGGNNYPFYYSPAMATVQTNTGEANILAAISSTYFDPDMDSGSVPKLFLLYEMYTGTVLSLENFTDYPKEISSLSFPLYNSSGNTGTFYTPPSNARPTGSPLIVIDDAGTPGNAADDFVAVILTLFVPPDSSHPCSYGEGYLLILTITGLSVSGPSGASVTATYARNVAHSLPQPPFIIKGALVVTESGHGSQEAHITQIGTIEQGSVSTSVGDAKFLYWKEVR